jgi:DNA repair ATPase RecN
MTPAQTQAAFSEVREALRNYGTWRMQRPYRARAEVALACIESEVARLEEAEVERDAALNEVAQLTEERDHYRFHFDQQEQRAEKAESELARLERIERDYDRVLDGVETLTGARAQRHRERIALAAEEGGDRE